MKRKLSEQDIGQLIRDLGGSYKKFEDKRVCPTCRTLLYRVDNRPFDAIGTLNAIAFPIEIKSAGLSFPFSDLKEHQRVGLGAWQDQHQAPAWFGLQMGTDPVNRGDHPRRLWLVPFNVWLQLETLLETTGEINSLPYTANQKGMRKTVQEHQLGAVELLAPYALGREHNAWTLPEDHIFRVLYLSDCTLMPLYYLLEMPLCPTNTNGLPKMTKVDSMPSEQPSLLLE